MSQCVDIIPNLCVLKRNFMVLSISSIMVVSISMQEVSELIQSFFSRFHPEFVKMEVQLNVLCPFLDRGNDCY